MTGPADSQVSGATQAGLPPHWQVPLTQRSPGPQHRPVGPQAGPLGQPPDGAQSDVTDASMQLVQASAQTSEVQDTAPSRHVHALQPSPSAKLSPDR